MSHKSPRIAERIAPFLGREFDAHYLGYFDCFNTQAFYEAHDVLEELWLPSRGTPNGGFYKGLIQFAGAFVHLQKNRLGPAVALLELSRRYLSPFLPRHEGLDIGLVLGLGTVWRERIEAREVGGTNPLHEFPPPRIPMPMQRD